MERTTEEWIQVWKAEEKKAKDSYARKYCGDTIKMLEAKLDEEKNVPGKGKQDGTP